MLLLLSLLCCLAKATPNPFLEAANEGPLVSRGNRALYFFYNLEYRAKDLWDAITEGDQDTFDTILACGCVYLDETNDGGDSALTQAILAEETTMALALIKEGADVNSQNQAGIGPLHMSCLKHFTNVTVALLEAGADVNLKSVSEERPIIYAVNEDDIELLEILIEYGAEINFQDAGGESPLHEASAYGAVESAEFLIKHGSNFTAKDNEDRTPRQIICACLSYDEREQVQCSEGSCSAEDIKKMEKLFDRAERNEITDDTSQLTIDDLWLAVVDGDKPEVRKIIGCNCVELQAITQSKTKNWSAGQTALHLAVIAEEKEICQILIDATANVEAKNSEGNTPLHLATKQNSKPIAAIFLDQGVDIDAQNNDGQTPLHIASQSGSETLIRLLIRNNASTDISDKQGATPVELLCACLLNDECAPESCTKAQDVGILMEALGEDDEEREREVVDLYFPGANFLGLNGDESDDNFGSDDGKDSLGKLIGGLIAFGVGFFIVYSLAIVLMGRRNRRLRRMKNAQQQNPGPSRAPRS